METSVVIVIIAHKSELSENEKTSLRQCYKILGKYPIKIICPEGLDVSNYKKINSEADIVFIDPKWQSTYEMFNRLKIDLLLYKKFKNYHYILFYELDAWVFKDELEYWCNRGYDYIGAPWFEHDDEGISEKILGIGNGGFSLRNVRNAISILNRIQFLKKLRKFWFRSHLQALWRFHNMVLFFKKQFHVRSLDKINTLVFEYPMHEDYYWTHFIGGTFTDYKVSEIEDAIKFSFEVIPAFLYKKNNNQLPFGCHAWEKYEPEFWKDFINVENKLQIKNA